MGSTSFLPQITTTSRAKESVSPVCDILSYFLHFICNWCLFVDCSISLSHLYYLLPEAFQCIYMILYCYSRRGLNISVEKVMPGSLFSLILWF